MLYFVCLKILTDFPFCLVAKTFLPKGIGGVFGDYSGQNKEYSEFVQSLMFGFILFNKNHIDMK